MYSVNKQAVVPYSKEQMYRLVNDVHLYPEFLDWIKSTHIIKKESTFMEASMEIGIGPFSKSFTTHNYLSENSCIELNLIDGPFKSFKGCWKFLDSEEGTLVVLEIDFAMQVSPLAKVFGVMFHEASERQLQLFIKRADRLYGKQ